jgi:hypothetical protein
MTDAEGLVSLRKLAWMIGVPLLELQQVAREAQADWRQHYGYFTKSSGPSKTRHLYPPKPRMKDIQRRLNRHVFGTLNFGDYAHGSLRGHSPVTNALPHAGKR